MSASTTSFVSPVDLLLGAYHRRLLGLLLMRPGQSFHLREIERLAGIPSGSAHRELKRMQQAGLLTATRVGNQVRYQADHTSFVFQELHSIISKTVVVNALRNALAPLTARIRCAFVFGTVAESNEGRTGNIDVIIVGDLDSGDIAGAMFPLHETIGRPINPLVMTPHKFRKRRQKRSFVARVMNAPKLLLIGSPDTL